MSIGKVNNNVKNIADYQATQKKIQEKAPQPDTASDVFAKKSAKDQKLYTYLNPKNATNAQLWEQYSKFANKHIGKQLGSVKSYIQGFIDGTGNNPLDFEKLEDMLFERYGLDADLDPANVEEGGKYSAENLSDTLVQFAKNLSGGDVAKADMLLDAVKKGFEIAERAWGGELPEISQRTYDLTIEKFKAWKSENT